MVVVHRAPVQLGHSFDLSHLEHVDQRHSESICVRVCVHLCLTRGPEVAYCRPWGGVMFCRGDFLVVRAWSRALPHEIFSSSDAPRSCVFSAASLRPLAPSLLASLVVLLTSPRATAGSSRTVAQVPCSRRGRPSPRAYLSRVSLQASAWGARSRQSSEVKARHELQ